jgi:phosphate starvation-inducible membrane PsiE
MPDVPIDRASAESAEPGSALHRWAQPVGSFLVEAFHYLGLFAIGAATVWAAVIAFIGMMSKGHASIEDLLLLFIYLEIGAMVCIYFNTNHMPVRFLIYVAITAITRHLIGYVNTHPKPDLDILLMTGATLVLAIAVLVLRYASFNFPSSSGSAAPAAAPRPRQPQ